MPGWFCESSLARQLNPFADQATVDQRRLDFYNTPQQTHNNLTAHIYGSEFHLLVPLSLSSLSHNTIVRAFSRCCDWSEMAIIIQPETTKKSWRETMKVLLNVNSIIFQISRDKNLTAFVFFIVVHIALRSFEEEEDHFVLYECQNNLSVNYCWS